MHRIGEIIDDCGEVAVRGAAREIGGR